MMLRKNLLRLRYSLTNIQWKRYSHIEWTTDRVRSTFINYFVENHDHQFVPSSSVVPLNDETLLFANAGMNQFKSIFLGIVDPKSPFATLKRAVNSQKCIRAGGKHNDLADVGKDTYHHTFFEMLGTWSFGNYFKQEAIEWAYDILVNKYGLDKERLYVSYFAGDEALGIPCDTEARDMWLKYFPANKVLPFGSKENFWEMGETGPCGPCSEIHYDLLGSRDASSLVNKDDPSVLEIWNLVFIQFHRESVVNSSQTVLKVLPSKHVDTGMGLERIASILQSKKSNYDIDIFQPIFDHIYQHTKATGTPRYLGLIGKADEQNGYKDMAYRAIADHLRSLCIAITDGAIPSNEKRGYVIRRILRRALRHCQVLNTPPNYLSTAVPIVISTLSATYPELSEKESNIQSILIEEEKAFASLLPRGMKYLNDILDQSEGTTDLISGTHAFYLYDTLGFPIDLTQMIVEERGFAVDMVEFDELMRQQKIQSKASPKGKSSDIFYQTIRIGVEQISYLQSLSLPSTNDEFKYSISQPTTMLSHIQAIILPNSEVIPNPTSIPYNDGEELQFGIILDNTSFYSESGGQISDVGTLTLPLLNGEKMIVQVQDVQACGPYIVHTCVAGTIPNRELLLDQNLSIQCHVDYSRRQAIATNHSFTHLLNYALRKALSPSSMTPLGLTTKPKEPSSSLPIDQKGSLVTNEKLRFDFSYSKSISLVELQEIENTVNDLIQQSIPIETKYVPLSSISTIPNLRAVFGESYPDPVRVVSIGPAIELCGGNHLQNTANGTIFLIIEETSIAKGIRRISAVTSQTALALKKISKDLLCEVITFEGRYEDEKSKMKISSYAQTESFLNELTILHKKIDQLYTISPTFLLPLPLCDKLIMKEKVNHLQKELHQIKKKYLNQEIDQKISTLVQEGNRARQAGQQFIVFHFRNEASNGISFSETNNMKKITTELTKEFASSPPCSYFLLISEDHKLTCVSSVHSTAIEKGITANEWMETLLQRFGGKGGGRSNMATGSILDDGENSIANEVIVSVREIIEKYEAKIK